MRNRASLVLMELLVMLLVFSVAAALCLNAFLRADQLSRELELRDRAAVLCQNAAEQLKQSKDPADLGALRQGDIWTIYSGGTDDLRLEIRQEEPPVANMGVASVNCFRADTETLLFSLQVGWQEVSP